MNATAAKWIAFVVLGLGAFTLGVLPIKISSALKWTRHGCQRSPRSQLAISLLLCCGAGVLLATALAHMLPEVRENIASQVKPGTFLAAIPLTETLLALGFFIVYGLDEVVHTALYRRQHSHHEHAEYQPIGGEDQEAAANSKPSASHGDRKKSCSDSPSAGHGHSHCPPAGLTSREPRPSAQNSLLRQSAGQHHYGTSECHGSHQQELAVKESTPLLPKSESEATAAAAEVPMGTSSGLLALLALSVHAVTEGLAIGLQNSASNVFFLLGAVCSHKFVIAFCLGMELSSGWGAAARVSRGFHFLYMAVFAGTSALGVLVGLLLTGAPTQGLVIQSLQAVAAGTLLYVTFCEVLPRERAKCHAGLLQFLAVLSGFLAILVLDTLVPHGNAETGGGGGGILNATLSTQQ